MSTKILQKKRVVSRRKNSVLSKNAKKNAALRAVFAGMTGFAYWVTGIVIAASGFGAFAGMARWVVFFGV